MADNIRLFGGIRNDDVVYITLPLYHTNGGVLGMGQMILGGSTVAIRRKFSASNFWNDCIKFNATVSTWRHFCCQCFLAVSQKSCRMYILGGEKPTY